MLNPLLPTDFSTLANDCAPPPFWLDLFGKRFRLLCPSLMSRKRTPAYHHLAGQGKHGGEITSAARAGNYPFLPRQSNGITSYECLSWTSLLRVCQLRGAARFGEG